MCFDLGDSQTAEEEVDARATLAEEEEQTNTNGTPAAHGTTMEEEPVTNEAVTQDYDQESEYESDSESECEDRQSVPMNHTRTRSGRNVIFNTAFSDYVSW